MVLDPRQRAFLTTDGCADNAVLLDLILRNQHQTFSSCYMASVDVRKAYDSVSHGAILGTARSYGFPAGMISYLEETYRGSTTCLVGDACRSEPVRPKGGMK